jgi:hypothetical protein
MRTGGDAVRTHRALYKETVLGSLQTINRPDYNATSTSMHS